jgi:tetratricopeptide (TPR) repeat protein
VLLGISFVIIPLIVDYKSLLVNKKHVYLLIILVTTITVFIYGLYLNIGAPHFLPHFYTITQQNELVANARLQPLYARLQRELLKAQLNHQVDPTNEQLIVNFATMHAKQHDGILPDQVLQLLHHILKSYPNHANVLGLLAVHNYKTQNYEAAIKYWQQIILLIPEKSIYTKEITLIESKIQQAQLLVRTQTQKK